MRKPKAFQITGLVVSLAIMFVSAYCFDGLFGDLAAPTFSAQSGFYEEPFALTIESNRDADIYYTLDGSEPTTDSLHYEGSINLMDPSGSPNVYTARTDLSAGFIAETDRFAVPEEPVDKANVIRAIAISKDGKEISPISTATYWIGDRLSAYHGTEVISLVSDPENFFGYETGIYVTGKTLDDFIKSGERDAMREPDNWRRWHGNYTNEGREWERPVHFDYVDSDGILISSDDAGIRIKGSSSRGLSKKSFRLFAREEYSGKDAFSVPFLDEYAKSKVALFSGAQDYRTLMYDALVEYVVHDLNFETLMRKPCYVFLNGEYWGFYWLQEEISEEYLTEHFSLPKDDAVIIKNGNPKTMGEKSDACIAEWTSLEEDEAPIDDARYHYLCSKMDMDSYIDYYAAEIYIARGGDDWPRYNEAWWRSADDLHIDKCDGRWRWILFDTDCLCLNEWDADSIAYTMGKSGLFKRLMEYEPFKQAFLDRLESLGTSEFDPVRLAPQFEQFCEMLREPAKKDMKQYYGDNKSPDEFEKEVAGLAEFLQKRPDYIKKLVKTYR